MTDVSVGHKVIDTIEYLDQNGNPMLVSPIPDSPPTWTKTAPDTTDTMVVLPDGTTATITAVAEGTDTVSLTIVVGGVTFAATQSLNITAAPQVLTSVKIAAQIQ